MSGSPAGPSSSPAESAGDPPATSLFVSPFELLGREDPPPKGRRFVLQRDEDETGVSGTGQVARGVQYAQGFDLALPGGLATRYAAGFCALRWRTSPTSTGLYGSIADIEAIHGHGGKTRIVWLDEQHEVIHR